MLQGLLLLRLADLGVLSRAEPVAHESLQAGSSLATSSEFVEFGMSTVAQAELSGSQVIRTDSEATSIEAIFLRSKDELLSECLALEYSEHIPEQLIETGSIGRTGNKESAVESAFDSLLGSTVAERGIRSQYFADISPCL